MKTQFILLRSFYRSRYLYIEEKPNSPHAYEHCSPCFLHVHLPVRQPALQLHLIISINFMGAGDRDI